MEGWLYLIRSNRFGLQYSRKRYFILQDQYLKSYKSVPVPENECTHVLEILNSPLLARLSSISLTTLICIWNNKSRLLSSSPCLPLSLLSVSGSTNIGM
ncbi:hypothetical protein H5410_058609 [Solanum commersonii]|uniref:Uncharacterized protein n=1 Tax=Solanum commersonii TaxID=4109 RepID=A0A9J5WRB7_SOLCO|nr:hypothetical protein H5410_058609 [Solanum commersonii]